MLVEKTYNRQTQVYEPDLSTVDLNKWAVTAFVLDHETDMYQISLEWARACPFEISQLQGKLKLSTMGLYDTVEGIVKQAGLPTKIYWQTAATWRRTNPIIADLAGQLGMSEEEIDDFFIQAAKIR